VSIKLRNLTPHPVTIHLVDGTLIELAAELPTPRCVADREDAGVVHTQFGPVATTRTRLLGHVLDLPEPTPGVWLIVSSRIAEACPERDDLVFPDEQVRIDGQIDHCRALGRIRPDLIAASVPPVVPQPE
jgi:hypothetical protein